VEMYDLKSEQIVQRPEKESEETWESQPRQKVPVIPTEERKNNFNEIELGFTTDKAIFEAKRCLRCDLEK